MTSDISITLTPDPDGYITSEDQSLFADLLSRISVIGATINYGYNKIPIANVHIAPVGANQVSGLQGLCDFDSFRRNPVILTINTKDDCLIFRGIIDGNSIAQQPGGISASFIVKSNFTLLNEVYPRLIGGNASTINKFSLPQTIGVINPATAADAVINPDILTSYPFFNALNRIYNTGVNMDQLAIRFLVSLCQILIDTQRGDTGQGLLVGGTEVALSNFSQVICALALNCQGMYEPLTRLISAIDPSFTDGFTVYATDALIGMKIQDNMAMLEDTMFRGLIRMLDEYQSIVVVANNKMFIVPNAPYLAPTLTPGLPSVGQHSAIPNVAYPADYMSFSFQDMGENTIKGVFTVAEPMTTGFDWISGQAVLNLNGLYTEDLNIENCMACPPPPPSTGNKASNGNKVFGNIEIKTFPGLASAYMTAAIYHKQFALKKAINTGSTTPNDTNTSLAPTNRIETDDATSAQAQADLLNVEYIRRTQIYLNNLAQMEYCRIKYGDRTGGISMPFNNNWVPGAAGSVFTRSPGIRIDFFVTDVTHNFSVGAPNMGNATTSVSFTGGRPGASINVGLSEIDLYQYTYDSGPYNSIDFCNAFLTDLSSTHGAPISPGPSSGNGTNTGTTDVSGNTDPTSSNYTPLVPIA